MDEVVQLGIKGGAQLLQITVGTKRGWALEINFLDGQSQGLIAAEERTVIEFTASGTHGSGHTKPEKQAFLRVWQDHRLMA